MLTGLSTINKNDRTIGAFPFDRVFRFPFSDNTTALVNCLIRQVASFFKILATDSATFPAKRAILFLGLPGWAFLFLCCFSVRVFAAAPEVCKNPGEEQKITLQALGIEAGIAYSTETCADIFRRLAGERELFLVRRRIRDLSPLRELKQLTVLSLEKNLVDDVSSLFQLTQLTWLNLSGNHIRDITPLGNLRQLEWLSLDNNQVTDIGPLSGNMRLTKLLMSNNRLEDIGPLGNLENLQTLYLGFNSIRDLSPVSTLKKLVTLVLDHNDVSDLSPLKNLKNLKWLIASHNQIQRVDALRTLTRLTSLDLRENRIADLKPIKRHPAFRKYRLPRLTENEAKMVREQEKVQPDLPSAMKGQATVERQEKTQKKPLPIEKKPVPETDSSIEKTSSTGQVKGMQTSPVPLHTLSTSPDAEGKVKRFPSGTRTAEGHMQASQIHQPPLRKGINPPEPSPDAPAGRQGPGQYEPSDPQYQAPENPLPATNFVPPPASVIIAGRIDVPQPHDKGDALEKPPAVEKEAAPEPTLGKRAFADICLKPDAEQLHTLNILAGKLRLEYKPQACEEMEKRSQKLVMLIVHNEQIKDISPLQHMKQLTRLVLYNNRIENIQPLSGLINLRKLGLDHNHISDINPLEKMTRLNMLSLHHNRIDSIRPLRNLKNLTTLSLHHNRIKDLSPLSGLTHLTWLELDGNLIDNIEPLSELVKLRLLRLNHNRISDISPLTELPQLSELHLNGNEIFNLPSLASLTRLRKLDLRKNPLMDVSRLTTMEHFKSFKLPEQPTE